METATAKSNVSQPTSQFDGNNSNLPAGYAATSLTADTRTATERPTPAAPLRQASQVGRTPSARTMPSPERAAEARARAMARKAGSPATAPNSTTTSASGTKTAPKGGKAKRRHPAAKSRIASLGLSLVGTIGLAVAMFQGPATTAGAQSGMLATSGAVTGALTADTSSSGGLVVGDSTVATVATVAAFKDGVYDGVVDRNKFGNFQVELTITNGKIANVIAIQEPGDGKSQRINSYAVPQLTSEAIAAQSATIDNVSGATYTSDSYKISLQSALDQASTATNTVAKAA